MEENKIQRAYNLKLIADKFNELSDYEKYVSKNKDFLERIYQGCLERAKDGRYSTGIFVTYRYNDPDSYKGTCVPKCNSNANITVLFGLGDTKGFCNRKCDTNSQCITEQKDLIKIQEKFTCNAGYYHMFYYCEKLDRTDSSQNIFYYNPNYTPGNIVLDLRLYNLKSYIIEFWYFTTDCDKITSGYIFYTDQIQLKKVETSYNAYTTAHDIRRAFTVHEGYWNQIVLEVIMTQEQTDKKKPRFIYKLIIILDLLI